jgi:hypothetical protein
MAMPITNELLFLQSVRHKRYAYTLNAQQESEIFVREYETVRSRAVVSSKQPAATPLLKRVEAIARGGLCDLADGQAVTALK